LVGRYARGTLDLGDGPVPSEGGNDAFALALDARGEVRWTKRWGGAGEQLAQAVVFVAKLDRAGRCLWSRRFGSPGDDSVGGVAVDSAGNIAVTGGLLGVADAG